VIADVSALVEAGWLSPLDAHFARTMARLAGSRDPLVVLAAAVASRAPAHGHVCAELPRLGPILDGDDQPLDLQWPELQGWLEALRPSGLLSTPERPAPLVLDEGGNLYLWRYWDYQRRLISALHARSGPADQVDESLLAIGLDKLFRQAEPGDLQRAAAEMAVRRKLAVISGGPGTGKTTTVVKLMALVEEQLAEPARILLVAPTGKAAARMQESVQSQLAQLEAPRVVKAVLEEVEATTIHRRLGWRPSTPTRFKHGPDNPLQADLVIVDEASMVDLALMTKLVEAVRPQARLVMLGDRDQLASVEAGAILGDICAAPQDTEQDLAGSIVHLRRSWRFDETSGIGNLARSVNAGDAQAALDLLDGDEHPSVRRIPASEGSRPEALLGDRLIDGYRQLAQTRDPNQALAALGAFRVLCAHRKGRFGMEALNRLAREQLARAGLVEGYGDWFHGRPVIVTRNDYGLGLFNGDTGVALMDEDGRLRVWFEGTGGALRALHPARLPACESVYAMTVHKSQGSEFERVLLLLPQQHSPILTRELVYTGLTRARTEVTLVGSAKVLKAAVEGRIQRSSGLRAALWGGA
jgi:exodeoxyribonuclease V alpha subunit